ncbi:hypothetical protein M501DRAFT_926393 [Patellaria atrata CBS 101060]|uniref:Pre-mRNA-splicing factor n=1 Tax=Patellaria atrata CBS 101060 TaxID=1346257 RepID=A0A9P4SIG6_9PEZI|nr:hypothetical protein M501DRAFT_926393 [Patellaria atrata CBS 101060]
MAPPKIQLSFGGAKKLSKPVKTRPPVSKLQDSDDDDAVPTTQEVSHFDQAAGGAITSNAEKKKHAPLVIPKQANRDWQEEHRRKRQRTPPTTGPNPNDSVGLDADNGIDILVASKQYGLTYVTHKAPEDDSEAVIPTSNIPTEVQEAIKVKTDDERALEALIGDNSESNLVVTVVDEEQDALLRDLDGAPENPTLDNYAAVPVEEFGAALLRGMGWKEGEAVGRRRGQPSAKLRVPERRPALLGLGAKEDTTIAVQTRPGAKPGKNTKKVDQAYNPIVLRNVKTGEQLTEEELNAKVAGIKSKDDKDGRDSQSGRKDSQKDYRSSDRPKDRYRDDRDREQRRTDHRACERREDRGGDRSRRDRSRSREDRDVDRSRRHRSRSREDYRRRYKDDKDSDRDRRDSGHHDRYAGNERNGKRRHDASRDRYR